MGAVGEEGVWVVRGIGDDQKKWEVLIFLKE